MEQSDAEAATRDSLVPGSRRTAWLPLAALEPGTKMAMRFMVVCIQLALVLTVIYQYQLESRTFFNVMALAFGGFAVQSLLPMRHRLLFFLGLSLAAIFVVLGIRDGAYLIFLALVLIGISHLPLRLSARMLLLVLAGGLFALWRSEMLPGPWSVAIWPILGSMFMFRLALYLYALKHDETPPTVVATLSYFFMLPNVCFPLFPVVDYSTFRRTYYDRDAFEIYTTGIKWIVRGLVHLILYRFVYMHLISDPMELDSLGELVQFLLATFLLYLRISGQFHLITGVLHLFGFRLPETHHLYYLASSFTDFWRRINIYWKDFMMKLVYYPSFFKLKRFGSNAALVGATAIVFFGTWFLHSYQWFWLRGGFPLAPQDGLFWGTLGALVVIGALGEMKRSRPRKLGRTTPWSLSLALRTVGTFTVICVLWSLWSSDSLASWLLMWGAAGTTSAGELLVLCALLLLGLAIAGKDWSNLEKKAAMASSAAYGLAAPATFMLIGLLALGWKGLYAPVAPSLAATVASVQVSTLNATDEAEQHKGYYENLDNPSRLSADLWQVTKQKPAHWVLLATTEAYRIRPDFIGVELLPNKSIVFQDQPLTTNSWGMRDKERVLAKPAGVYRIAMLGASHVMGSGVSDDNTSARLLEEMLNQSSGGGRRYEVLNFGIGGFAFSRQLAILEPKVLKFEPDAIFFVGQPGLDAQVVQHFLTVAVHRLPIPFPHLEALMQETGVRAVANEGAPMFFDAGRAVLTSLGVKTRMPWTEAQQRLHRSVKEFERVTFEEMSAITRKHGVVPVFVALDLVRDPPKTATPALEYAKATGMLVFDMLDVWQGRDQDALRVGSWDDHPNAAGNRVVAERLYQLIQQHASELGIDGASQR